MSKHKVFGGRPDASEADPAAMERFFLGQGRGAFIEGMKADVLVVGDRDVDRVSRAPKALRAPVLRNVSSPALDYLRLRSLSVHSETRLLASSIFVFCSDVGVRICLSAYILSLASRYFSPALLMHCASLHSQTSFA
jgi:hypothetical protein